jgi:hypothetical protein
VQKILRPFRIQPLPLRTASVAGCVRFCFDSLTAAAMIVPSLKMRSSDLAKASALRF